MVKSSAGKKGARQNASSTGAEDRLELVLKTDSIGTEEAVISSLELIETPGVVVDVIQAGTGDVSKSDLFMAETGSRLVMGFNVGVLPKIKELASERGVEVRLHDVIYRLCEDVSQIAKSMVRKEEQERITGRAKVIALFPGGRKGVILGCEVLDGTLAVGKHFKLISEPGIVYVGTIGSLHIEERAVKEASKGQQVGLKISGFKRAKKGDLLECFETLPVKNRRWQPRGGVFDLRPTETR